MNTKLQEIFDTFINDNDASDLHLRTDNEPLLRTSNKISKLTNFEKISANEMKSFVKDFFIIRFGEVNGLEEYNQAIEKSVEIDTAIQIPGSNYRARVNIFKSLGNYSIVCRKIPHEMPDLDKLNFYGEHILKIKEIIGQKEGLILVTGQTGSGKSTTLASIIDYINHLYTKHIITIEDPVEFLHTSDVSLITHREVGLRADTITFEKGLKAALREDPDIIMIGELRDAETTLAALQAAQTGHIVFATLHTNSAPETILRVLDMFPAEKAKSIKTSLATSLKLIISQKLGTSISNKKILLYEMLINNTQIQNLIIKDDFNDIKISEIMLGNMTNEHSMLPMNYCLMKRLEDKNPDLKISKKVAIENSSDIVSLNGLIERTEVDLEEEIEVSKNNIWN
jgi:twitching motility protein PilT